MDENDIVLTTATDSMEMYQSRLEELRAEEGELTKTDAAVIYGRYLQQAGIEHVKELG